MHFESFLADLANQLEVAISDGKSIEDMNKQIEEELQNFKQLFEGKCSFSA